MSSKWFAFRSRPWAAGIVAVALIAAVALAADSKLRQAAKEGSPPHGAWYTESGATQPASPPAASTTTPPAGPATTYGKQLSRAFHAAAERVLPSVVMITNTPAMKEPPHNKNQAPNEGSETMPFGFQGTPFGDLFKNPEFRKFFGEMPSMPEMPRHETMGAGSGVIVDPSGVILTNYHVVAGGGRVMVRLRDGREFTAYDIKGDPQTDLAVLRIKGAENLPAAKLGNSDTAEVGDWVLALGEPFGLEGTVTAGIVSARDRGIGVANREDFIQTDAAINPGNSGGPLVNLDREVIGINTAISTTMGGNEGVGFAIPINLAKWVGGQLAETGKVHRAYLGVIIQPVTHQLADQFKVKVREGVLVTEVQPKTPAAKAGLKPGDVILQFEGKSISRPRELQSLVERSKIGSTQTMIVLRDGNRMTLKVSPAELPANFAVAGSGSRGMEKQNTSWLEKLGIQVENLTPEVAAQLDVKVDHGVVITDVRSGSPADMAGLTSGMVITEANRHPINSVEDLRSTLSQHPLTKGVLLLVRTGEGARFVVIRVEND